MYRRNRKKLQAFTLTEVMVTMAVSSVVVLLAYAILQMLNTYFSRVNTHSDLHAEWLSFRLFMSRDVSEADSAFFEEDVLIFHRDSTEINWYSRGDTLIRGTDQEKKFYLRPHTLSTSRDTALPYISLIQVSYPEGEEETVFRFMKQYPVATLINQ